MYRVETKMIFPFSRKYKISNMFKLPRAFPLVLHIFSEPETFEEKMNFVIITV